MISIRPWFPMFPFVCVSSSFGVRHVRRSTASFLDQRSTYVRFPGTSMPKVAEDEYLNIKVRSFSASSIFPFISQNTFRNECAIHKAQSVQAMVQGTRKKLGRLEVKTLEGRSVLEGARGEGPVI
jgi:hypothetical protein